MHLPCLLSAADASALRRLDPLLMSQESLLESFLGGVKNKGRFTDSNGNYNFDIPSRFRYADEEGGQDRMITQISLDGDEAKLRALGGSFSFRFLPLSVYALSLKHNDLEGPLDVDFWPAALQDGLFGELSLQNLSDSIDNLLLDSNEFTGRIEAVHVPISLIVLQLADCKFDGTFAFKDTSGAIQDLSMHSNDFWGPIMAADLPRSMMPPPPPPLPREITDFPEISTLQACPMASRSSISVGTRSRRHQRSKNCLVALRVLKPKGNNLRACYASLGSRQTFALLSSRTIALRRL